MVIFKKEDKKKIRSEPKIKENNFISDGGLSNKTKYSDNRTLTKTKNSIPVTTNGESFYEKTPNTTLIPNHKSIKGNKSYSNENEKIKSEIDNKKERMKKFDEEIKKNIKIKTKKEIPHNNSTKKNIRINNYIDKDNNEDLSKNNSFKLNQTNHSKSSSKNENNISGLEKRKNYVVPQVKPKKVKTEESKIEETNIEEEEEEKNKLITQLVYNKEVECIQDFQKKFQDESQNKVYKETQRKIKVLENNNFDVEGLLKKHEEFNEEEKEKRESDDEKDYENEFEENEKAINNKNDNSHNNSNKTYSKHSNNSNNVNEDIYKVKQIRKPKVNIFEYDNKIRYYRNNSSDISNRLLTDNITNNRSQSEKENSFRKSSINTSEKKNNIKRADSKTVMVFDDDDNFEMAYKEKKTGRTKKEIQEFMRKRKLEKKKESIKIEENAKKKEIKNYYQLAKLLKETEKTINNKRRRKNSNSKNNNLKIKNEYYIGKNRQRKLSNASHLSDSTIIDKDEFLLNILDSKKIINSGLRIDDNGEYINKEKYDQLRDEEEQKNNKEKINDNSPETKEKFIKMKKDLLYSNGSNDSFKDQIQKAKKTVKKSEDIINEKHLEDYLQPKIVSKENEKNYSSRKEQLRDSLNKSKKSKSLTESQYEEELKDNIINDEIPSIQVPSTIQPSNINTFNALSRENENFDKDNSIKTSDYQFDEEALEAYGEIFDGLSEFLKSIYRRKVLNDIIIYVNTRYRYKIGFEQLILLFKLSPFNALRLYEHFLIYNITLRNIVLPYIRRAFSNIVFYAFSIKRITLFNQIIEQIFKSVIFRKIQNFKKKKNNTIIPSNNNIKENKENNIKNDKLEQQKKIIEEKKAKQPMNDSDIEKKLKNAINIFENPLKSNAFNNIKEYGLNKDNSNQYKDNSYSQNEERRRNNSNPLSEYSNSYLSQKNNTYMYESFDEKNSIMLYPNSEDSDRLHRIYQLIEAQQEGRSNISQSEQMDLSGISNQTGKSNKSSKSLSEITKMKPGIKIGSLATLKQKNNNDSSNDKNDLDKIKNLSPIAKKDNIDYIQKNNSDDKNNNNDKVNEQIQKIPKTKIDNNEEIYKKKERNNSSEFLKGNQFDQDISADKDTSQYEWEYTIPVNKSGGKNTNPNSEKINFEEMPLQKNNLNEIKENKKEIKENNINTNSAKKEPKENSYSEEEFNKNIEDLEDKPDSENILKSMKEEEKNLDNSKSVNNIEEEILEEIEIQKEDDNNKKEINKINIENENKPTPKLNDKNKKSIESENSENTIVFTNKNENKNVFSINNSVNNTIELSNSIKLKENSGRNNNRYGNQIEENEKEQKTEIKKENKDEEKNDKNKEIPLKKSPFENINKDKFVDEITEEIIKNLLFSEIKDDKKQILPKKTQKFQLLSPILSRSTDNNPQIGNESNDLSFATQSDTSNLNNSFFMRSVIEIKKDVSLNLYNEKVAPKLLKCIGKEIDKEYINIIDNLNQPLRVNETELMNGIMLKDDRILSNPNSIFYNSDIQKKEFINKTFLKDFEKVDKEIRNEDNIISDEYYDNILNECVVDAANELIEKERKYGKVGEPIKWSIRNREIEYKYKKDNNSKKNFRHTILKQLYKMINYKMALIAENYDYMDSDQLTNDRDKKFYNSMIKELREDDEEWKNFDNEETQIKLVLSKVILDQLLNEVVEILEHVFYSRKEPSKYQSKSIYACEDIPRLFFQNTTENNYYDLNDNMNQ